MGRPLTVLLVEDSPEDAQLIVQQLESCGWDVTWERVDTREAMTATLGRSTFDLIVSDYHMPSFRALDAMKVWKERGLDTPFVVVTGTIGEEQAVEVLKAGAHDFFLKDRLSRLCSAVERELREAEKRRTLERTEREREEALQRLARSERLFHDLFESAPDATVIVDGQGVIRAASRQAERLFGYDPEELSGQPVEVLIPSAARSGFRELREQFVEAPAPVFMGAGRQNLFAARKDGATFPVEISLSPLTTEADTVIAAVRDMTARRQLEEQLRQVQKMEAVGRLAGGIAHDFNNILGVILGHSQILLSGLAPNDPRRPRVDQIMSASQRAAGLTRQLLAFSRRQVFETRVLDLNQTIESVIKMLGRLIGEDVTLSFRPGESLGRVRADPTQIEQVLMNLAVNARDAMPQGGRVVIETSNAAIEDDYRHGHAAAAGPYVCIAVSDTGHGMTKDVQSHIFEPFFTTKEAGKGTGLGLSTVYGIVKQSEGLIYVYSEPGHGTTFKIYLPAVEGEVERPAEPSPSRRGSETVLLVEDEDGLRALIGELLEEDGYHVLAAENPTKAIEAAETYEGVIHLLLTDVVMPQMSGRDVARRVKERRPDVRVLYMSGYTEDAIANRGVLEAGSSLISKPFTQEALTRKLRELLDPASRP
ncbi:MAG: hybrid sensor histidine kinase/response regulator [Acidobacteria bacterium]|nr:MAG: hybrid sensor histidine kinase/response regulator [Acidobacteriota bacterium]